MAAGCSLTSLQDGGCVPTTTSIPRKKARRKLYLLFYTSLETAVSFLSHSTHKYLTPFKGQGSGRTYGTRNIIAVILEKQPFTPLFIIYLVPKYMGGTDVLSNWKIFPTCSQMNKYF